MTDRERAVLLARLIREREPDPMILERERPLRLRPQHQPKGRP